MSELRKILTKEGNFRSVVINEEKYKIIQEGFGYGKRVRGLYRGFIISDIRMRYVRFFSFYMLKEVMDSMNSDILNNAKLWLFPKYKFQVPDDLNLLVCVSNSECFNLFFTVDNEDNGREYSLSSFLASAKYMYKESKKCIFTYNGTNQVLEIGVEEHSDSQEGG